MRKWWRSFDGMTIPIDEFYYYNLSFADNPMSILDMLHMYAEANTINNWGHYNWGLTINMSRIEYITINPNVCFQISIQISIPNERLDYF